MIRFPTTIERIEGLPGEVRAGGTDVMERRRSGRAAGPLLDLRDVGGLGAVEAADGGLRIGARVTLAALADDARAPAGLRAAAAGTATPQIRAVGTVGGNLMQHVRCWYYRNPQFACWRAGGAECLARSGDHAQHVCFDTAPCVAPHPSTLGCALVAYEAEAELLGGARIPVAALLASTVQPLLRDGVRPAEGRPVVVAVRVPEDRAEERGVYVRTISRSRAEWPLVEAVVRLRVEAGVVAFARIAVGGVASVPLRREAAEATLVGKAPTDAVLEAAAAAAAEGANPLPMTAYKVDLLRGTVREALERGLA